MGRGEPDRSYQAQRAGIFRGLVDAERVNEADAEHRISQWEREAEDQGVIGSRQAFGGSATT